jgi:L-threonylcarbamoyladenylate synthase
VTANLSFDNDETRQRAGVIVAQGGCIGFRTDTFYGLGVDPLNADAVVRMKKVKGRDDGKPILLLISDLEILDRFITERSEMFAAIVEKFWPGPLTVIGKATSAVPVEITAGTGTIGVRLPDNESVRALVRTCGGALTATSANPAGQPPATSAAAVYNYFSNNLRLIIDSGEVNVTEPSTVLDATKNPPIVIRAGLIKQEDISASLR